MLNRSSKILLVDDHAPNLLALNVVLRDCGYELIDANSGEEAVRLTQEHDFAVILLDVQMPGLDGFETANLIRSSSRSKATPIIFITANNFTEISEQRGYVAGAVDYLFKPINTEILKAKLQVFSDLKRNSELVKESAVREKENEMLKNALKLRDEFLAMAAHELKTPITPLNLQMQAFIKMLEEGTFGEIDPGRLHRMLRIASEQIHKLNHHIDEMLDVSRITSGKLDLKTEEVDLGLLVGRLIDIFRVQLGDRSDGITHDLELGVIGRWDRYRIEQAVENLLSNSMKYGEGKPIHVTVSSDGANACVKVKDLGVGIREADQRRIFERFERAASNHHHGGLGLGLFITNQIALRHGGSIQVRSRPGEGAEFALRLPVNQINF